MDTSHWAKRTTSNVGPYPKQRSPFIFSGLPTKKKCSSHVLGWRIKAKGTFVWSAWALWSNFFSKKLKTIKRMDLRVQKSHAFWDLVALKNLSVRKNHPGPFSLNQTSPINFPLLGPISFSGWFEIEAQISPLPRRSSFPAKPRSSSGHRNSVSELLIRAEIASSLQVKTLVLTISFILYWFDYFVLFFRSLICSKLFYIILVFLQLFFGWLRIYRSVVEVLAWGEWLLG